MAARVKPGHSAWRGASFGAIGVVETGVGASLELGIWNLELFLWPSLLRIV